jgi:hypothetical protein
MQKQRKIMQQINKKMNKLWILILMTLIYLQKVIQNRISQPPHRINSNNKLAKLISFLIRKMQLYRIPTNKPKLSQIQ